MNPRRSLVEAAEQIALNEQFKLKSINYKPKSRIRGLAFDKVSAVPPPRFQDSGRKRSKITRMPKIDRPKTDGPPGFYIDLPDGFRRDPGFNIPDRPDRGYGGIKMPTPGPDFSGDTPPKGYMVNPRYKPRDPMDKTADSRRSDRKFIPDTPMNRFLNSPRKPVGDTKRPSNTKRPSVAPVPSMYDKFKKAVDARDSKTVTRVPR